MRTLLGSLLLFAPSLALAQEPTREERLQFLERELEAKRAELHVAGCAIAVVQKDQVIWAKGLGLADVESKRAATPETLFAIGSSTKAFTATLVGMLVDEGKLAWDAPITDTLPEFRLPIRTSDASAKVSLRDMLSHRTGFSRGDVLWASGRASVAAILGAVVHAEPWAEFRKEFHYNNVMFLAAGEAAAKVAEKPWSALVDERLFAPLGMKDTSVSVARAQKDPRLALGYEWSEEAQRYNRKPMRVLDAIAPAGAINSNVLDMARWVRFQLGRGEFEGKRLISKEVHAQTWTQQIEMAPGIGYGMGWMLRTWKGQRVVEHGGNIDGFAAEVALLPDSDLGFVLLTNVTATPLQALSMQLVWDAMLGDIHAKEGAATVDRAPYLGTYVANFATFHDARIKVLEQNGKLAVDVPGQMVFALHEPDAEGKWVFELTDQIAVSFERDRDERVVALVFHQAGLLLDAPREGVAIPSEIDLDDARRFLGKYSDPELKADVTVVIRNQRLAVDVPQQMVFELHAPDADGKRHLRAISALAVRFEEAEDGRVRGLTFFERGTERFCPRVAGAEESAPPISLEALHELRHSDARAAAVAALGTYRIAASVKLLHAGVEGRSTSVGEGDERWKSKVDLEPFATIETCYDRGFAAIAGTITPYQELDGVRRRAARLDHPLASVLDWRELYPKIAVLRADELDGRKVWVVRLVLDDDVHVTAWVDAATGDTLREDGAEQLPGGAGEIATTTRFSDFRTVEGLSVPHAIESKNDESGTTVVRIETIEPRIAPPESGFRLAEVAGAPKK